MTLIERIKGQLDEDERVARATVPGPWRVSKVGHHVVADDPDIMVMENFDEPLGPWHLDLPHHIARHDPARVLRQVAAMRKVLEAHSDPHGRTRWRAEMDPDWEDREYCGTCRATPCQVEDACDVCGITPCPTMLALAEGYGIEAE